MIIFALNTAFAALDGAIVRDGVTLAEAHEPLARGQEQRLPGFVDALFAQAGLTLRDVTRLAVIAGPGSFTGVRVGVAYMRGLALVTGVPCLGITTLEAAIPSDVNGAALACLAAKKRAPDRSWWVQPILDGEGCAPVEELHEAETAARLNVFQGAIFLDGPEAFDALAVRTQPFAARAVIAAERAARFDPAKHPPSPVYARAPDATLPAPRA